MERLKFTENPDLNEKVEELIGMLKNELINHFNPKSIILTGSFARGEATIIEEKGRLKFLSDCEVIIIPNREIFRRKIKKFTSQFYEKTGLKVNLSGTILSINLLIPFLRKRMKPRIDYYDLKHGSKVIYGKDYLKNLPDFSPEEIPLWEGIRLIFNRMAESIEHLSFENPGSHMVYWADKVILACQDALLLSEGKYYPSFVERHKVFQSCHDCFNRIDSRKILTLSEEATERKLNWFNVNNPLDYWSEVAGICDVVFRYLIKKDIGIEFADYTEFERKYLNSKKIKKCTHKAFSNPFYVNTVNLIKALVSSQNIPFKLIKGRLVIPWEHIAYSKIPFLYFNPKNCNEKEDILKLWKATGF